MKNGTPSNNLILVDSAGQVITGQEAADDAAYEYGYREESVAPVESSGGSRNTLLLFMAVSFACTAAAVATGSYAVWLSRHAASQQALTDVNDLLKTCQTRMRQLETDYRSLPN